MPKLTLTKMLYDTVPLDGEIYVVMNNFTNLWNKLMEFGSLELLKRKIISFVSMTTGFLSQPRNSLLEVVFLLGYAV